MVPCFQPRPADENVPPETRRGRPPQMTSTRNLKLQSEASHRSSRPQSVLHVIVPVAAELKSGEFGIPCKSSAASDENISVDI